MAAPLLRGYVPPPPLAPLSTRYGSVPLVPLDYAEASNGTRSGRATCVQRAGRGFRLALQTSRSALYLVVNGYVSCLVWAALLALVMLSVLLCPLCGLGWLLFRQLFRVGVVELFAACDAVMANFVASANEQIQLEPQDLPHIVASSPYYELLDDLWDISPQGLRALLYLLTVKLALGVLGLFLLLVALWTAQTIIQDVRLATAEPLAAEWLVWLQLLLMIVALMLLLTGLDRFAAFSSAATRLFLCRKR